MTKKNAQYKNSLQLKVETIIQRLKLAHPEAKTALQHSNPFELLIATILSAQCTDVRVNIVTKDLFRKYRGPKDFATVPQRELEKDIHSTGFFRAKAKNIIGCCTMLVEKHGGNVPSTMEELLELPGVGRKTANVVLGNAFGKAEGVVVDTHVQRLSGRLGFTKETTPEKIEKDLITIIPRTEWIIFPHLMIWHGRKVCKAKKPLCGECVISDECPSVNNFIKAPSLRSGL